MLPCLVTVLSLLARADKVPGRTVALLEVIGQQAYLLDSGTVSKRSGL